MRNRYKGICFRCGKEVPPHGGWFQSRGSLPLEEKKKLSFGGRWLVRCEDCKNTGNKISFGKIKE